MKLNRSERKLATEQGLPLLLHPLLALFLLLPTPLLALYIPYIPPA
jgi:hypothetical protein